MPDIALPQPSSDRAYRYRAFISYRHVEPDRRWAMWLHSAIESYRIPKRLSTTLVRSARLGRVFRDEEELSASADLSRVIKEALNESDFLIVICSPRAPDSQWVNQEVVYFRELGRGDRILALLIEGEPQQSFPRALREIRHVAADNVTEATERVEEVEPLAADARVSRSETVRRVRRVALLRLLACLLNCRFDDLRQREHERRLRQLGYLGTFFAALSMVMLGLAAFAVYQRGRAEASLVKEQQALHQEQLAVAGLQAEQTRLRQTLARQHIERGVNLCSAGNSDRGLATLYLGHETAPDGDPLRGSARSLLGGWIAAAPLTLRHQKWVTTVAFGPDGRTALTGSDDHTARLWNVTTGEAIGEPMRHDDVVRDVAFSPDGRTLLTGSWDKTARLWDAATSAAKGKVLQHDDRVQSVAFSPDGQTIATGSKDKTARLWDAGTGEPKLDPIRHDRAVEVVLFSPDGKTLLTAWGDTKKDGGAQLWNAASGAAVGQTLSDASDGHAAAFSPDGRTVATGNSEGVSRLWDATTGIGKGKPMRHAGAIFSLAFSPDGKTIATGSIDQTARLWDATTCAGKGEPMRHQGTVSAVKFSPDGRLVLTGSWDNTVQLWDATTGKPKGEALPHSGYVVAAEFNSDGQTILTGSWDYTARLWDIAAISTARSKALRHSNTVNAVAISCDGRTIVTASFDKTARLWDAATGAARGQPMRHEDALTSVAISPDGQTVVTGSADKTARRWDASAGAAKGQPMRHEEIVAAVAVSPDGTTILTGWGHIQKSRDTGGAQLWNAITGEAKGEPLQHSRRVDAIAFSPNGQLAVTAGWDRTASLWDATTGFLYGSPMRHDGGIMSVAFSPDGQTIATGSADDTARLWDTATCTAKGKPLPHESNVNAVAFSPDGRTLLTGWGENFDPAGARLWDVATGAAKGNVMRHESVVNSVAFSPDGQTILTASADKTSRMWDANTGAARGEPMRHQGAVHVAAFSPDGNTVVTAGDDKLGRLWVVPGSFRSAPPDQLRLSIECRTALVANDDAGLRALSPEEWDARCRQLTTAGGLLMPYSAEQRESIAMAYGAEAALECEQRRNWFGVVFQIDRVLRRSPNDSELLARRGAAFAEQGDWSRAVTDYAAVVELKNSDGIAMYALGLAQLGVGDEAGYRDTVAMLKTLAESSGVAQDAGTATRLRMLTPIGPEEDAMPWAALAKKAASGELTLRHIETFGAALYRARRFDDSVKVLDAAGAEWRRTQKGNAIITPRSATAWSQLFLAMAHQQLGQDDEAKQYFDEAIAQISETNAQQSWDERLRREVLCREAEIMIAYRSAPSDPNVGADPAPAN